MSRLAPLALCVLTTACIQFPSPDFGATGIERHVKYSDVDDTLQLLEIYHGLVADDVAAASEALLKLEQGWRRFPSEGGFISFDLDNLDPWLEETESEVEREFIRHIQSVEDLVQVQRAGLFSDEQGRVGFYRLTQFDDASRMLGVANDLLNAGIRRDAERRTEFTPGYPHFDKRTRELCDQAAELDHAWFAFEGKGFALDAPMTKANAARCLHHLMKEASGPHGREAVEAFDYLATVEVQDERAKLLLEPDGDGWFHFLPGEETETYRPRIREELEAAGHSLEAVTTLAEVRALLGNS